jgi:putative PIN family toxin of toxin-antitoxin system
VVFDTNVVVSALLLNAGPVAAVRAIWQSRRVTPLVSRATTSELLRVLAYPKFKLTVAEMNELLHDFLPFAEVVVIPEPAPPTPRCRDPKDVPFLELAIAAGADALVTGDQDLLALKDKLSVPLLRPEDWLASF